MVKLTVVGVEMVPSTVGVESKKFKSTVFEHLSEWVMLGKKVWDFGSGEKKKRQKYVIWWWTTHTERENIWTHWTPRLKLKLKKKRASNFMHTCFDYKQSLKWQKYDLMVNNPHREREYLNPYPQNTSNKKQTKNNPRTWTYICSTKRDPINPYPRCYKLNAQLLPSLAGAAPPPFPGGNTWHLFLAHYNNRGFVFFWY